LHVYHLLFDKVLRTAEEEYFFGDLVALSQGMLWASQAQYEAVKGTSLEEIARRNVAYFAVATRRITVNICPEGTIPGTRPVNGTSRR